MNNFEKIVALLETILTGVTPTVSKSDNPERDAQILIRKQSFSVAKTSALLAIPPGGLGLATGGIDILRVLHSHLQIWVNIAALYGRTSEYAKRTFMVSVLINGGGKAGQAALIQLAEKYSKRAALRELQKQFVKKIGIKLTQKALKRGIASAAPIIGAAGVGALVYWQTKKVGGDAIAAMMQAK